MYMELVAVIGSRSTFARETICAGDRICRSERIGAVADEDDEIVNRLMSRFAVQRMMLLYDMALEARNAADVHALRDAGGRVRFSFSTDEAAPAQLRFLGLRFQVTIVYALVYDDRSTWNACNDYPFRRKKHLCDIINCRGKTGGAIIDVVTKQLWRLGYLIEDTVSASSDGGGENEGQSGLHAHLMHRIPSFVPRRALDHIGWRVTDKGIAQLGQRHDGTKAIATYLKDGSTWRFLDDIATAPVADGGLGLMSTCENPLASGAG